MYLLNVSETEIIDNKSIKKTTKTISKIKKHPHNF